MISLHSPFVARCFEVFINRDGAPGFPVDTVYVQSELEFRFESDSTKWDVARIDVVVDGIPSGAGNQVRSLSGSALETSTASHGARTTGTRHPNAGRRANFR
jgi:hypothetical protein